ncbi:hypothetical protein JX265_013011 [Neoarthrinium moseri]|uniref:Uncharacterized protein n=1 Tax=Neoarthrinium moseri TaxID=1658444 RepID=A0A9P9W980_9PEZI|nr:hypothetical protein JX265_013011 [Neoarthrinium moseri]
MPPRAGSESWCRRLWWRGFGSENHMPRSAIARSPVIETRPNLCKMNCGRTRTSQRAQNGGLPSKSRRESRVSPQARRPPNPCAKTGDISPNLRPTTPKLGKKAVPAAQNVAAHLEPRKSAQNRQKAEESISPTWARTRNLLIARRRRPGPSEAPNSQTR